MNRPQLIGLVADDLTGATDSAVGFAEAGWTAVLERHPTAASSGPLDAAGPTLLAVATGVRAATDAAAADRTAAAVRGLMARGIDRLFVKIDSTVRGSVAGQVTGALTAWREAHPDAVAVVCPAFPALGRTVANGTVLVRGVPVAASAAGTDPVTPVSQSRLDRLLPGAFRADLAGLDDPRADRLLLDATSDDDLARIAGASDRLGARAVAVGSGGLAQAIARHRAVDHAPTKDSDEAARRILIAVSSVHPDTDGQLARLRAEGHDPGLHMITSPRKRVSADQAAAMATGLAAQVAQQLRDGGYDALVLVGGDGAAATLDLLGVRQLTISGLIQPGIPDGRIVGGVADGLRVVTKSGGFGPPDSLLTIVRRLRRSHPPTAGATPASTRPQPKDVS